MDKKNQKLKVKYLTTVYKRQANETQKNRWLAENVKLDRTYVSLELKTKMIEKIVNDTLFDEEGNYKRNSVVQYISYRMNLINIYTNVEIDFGNIIEEYDLLKETGLFEKLLKMIPESEKAEFTLFLNMTNSDVDSTEHDPYAFMDTQVNKFAKMVSEQVSSSINGLADFIEKLNPETIELLGNKLGKLIS